MITAHVQSELLVVRNVRRAAEVSLRNLRNSDLMIFFEQQVDPNEHALINSQTSDRNVYFKHWKLVRGNDANYFKTIIADGEIAGYVLSWRSSRRRLISYWLGKEYSQKGIAQSALTMFLVECKSRPLFARVAKQNLASLRVLRASGFIQYCSGLFTNMHGEVREEDILSLGSIQGKQFDPDQARFPLM
jgi:RimJ/RimL family protein N-acetyltransferase